MGKNMRETIVNILIFILFINLIMIIFPEGKTQKYCKLVIKLFLFIYIINSIVLRGTISLDRFLDFSFRSIESSKYEREIDLVESQKEFITLINNDLYKGEEVIKNIKLAFTNEMQLTVTVFLNQSLDLEDQENLKINISNIFNTNSENVEIDYWQKNLIKH